MFLKQLYLDCLAQASYLVADEGTGRAAVVDPRRDVDVYVDEAARHGFEIEHVLLTHLHADFASGHLELRARTGAEIHLGARTRPEYPCTPAKDGDVIALGAVKIGVLETPGHTPESISLLVWEDGSGSAAAPHAVLTGDTLFIGDVGRPDLMASVGFSREELAGMLHDSLHEKILPLPDETLVYPGHGAGSLCGKSLSKETSSTLGQQRSFNYALQPMGREEFIGLVTQGQPAAPAYFSYDARFNQREHGLLDEGLRELGALPLSKVLALQQEGTLVVDTRDPEEFARGHIPRALNIGLGGQYASWAGTLIPPETPLAIVAPPGKEQESALRLGRIGFDLVRGYLEGGPDALKDLPRQVGHTRLDPADFRDALARGDQGPFLVDVRRPAEWESAHIEEALNLPLASLVESLDALPRNRPLAVYCQGGYRSCIAVSLLQHHGFHDFVELRGGFGGWDADGLPVVRSNEPSCS